MRVQGQVQVPVPRFHPNQIYFRYRWDGDGVHGLTADCFGTRCQSAVSPGAYSRRQHVILSSLWTFVVPVYFCLQLRAPTRRGPGHPNGPAVFVNCTTLMGGIIVLYSERSFPRPHPGMSPCHHRQAPSQKSSDSGSRVPRRLARLYASSP